MSLFIIDAQIAPPETRENLSNFVKRDFPLPSAYFDPYWLNLSRSFTVCSRMIVDL